MYSPELVSSNETLPDYQFVSSDQDWLRTLGFSWDVEQEQAKLDELNHLLNLVAETPVQSNGAPNLYALNNRMKFVNLFTTLDEATYDKLINRSDWQLTPKTVIGTQRLLHDYGINNLNAVTQYPEILNHSPESIRSRLENLVKLGFNPVRLINNNSFILEANPRTINTRLRVLHSAARAWKIDDYERIVNNVIEQNPELLTHSVGRNRVLVRILNNSLPPGIILTRRQIRPLIRNHIEGMLAGYLDMEKLPVSPEFLLDRGNHFKRLGTLAMRNIILDPMHANDTAVRAYHRMKTTKASPHYNRQARNN